jgi:ABC-2 type transport system permease protein
MKSRFASLAALYIKSTLSISLPSKMELRKPKTPLKTLGIGLGILFIVADLGFIFVMMNLSLYNGLKPVGMQGMMLLNAATMASVLVFILSFLLALSMFSMSGMESNMLSMPFSARELLGAKMFLVYVLEAILGAFIVAIATVIYGIKEASPIMFYVNGAITALAIPLAPIAIAYLVLIPLMKAAKLLRNKNFILYVGGFIGIGLSLVFNVYIQTTMAQVSNPEVLAKMAGPESIVSRMGQAWLPSWLAWKSLADASSLSGLGAAIANLGLGVAACALVVLFMANGYVASVRSFNESSFERKKLNLRNAAGKSSGIFVRNGVMKSLVLREFRLMNREPIYLLNGPFVVILMPIILAIAFFARAESFRSLMKDITPLLAGPGGYLVPAAFGGFLGTSTSIACTAVSRDAKALSWMKALPVTPFQYFTAKLIHAEIFVLLGSIIGCIAGAAFLGSSAGDAILGFGLSMIFATALTMLSLWLDTAFPRLRWDNPVAAMKQNPNAVVAILGAMALMGGIGALSILVSLPRYAYAGIIVAVSGIVILVWCLRYPRDAKKRLAGMEP